MSRFSHPFRFGYRTRDEANLRECDFISLLSTVVTERLAAEATFALLKPVSDNRGDTERALEYLRDLFVLESWVATFAKYQGLKKFTPEELRGLAFYSALDTFMSATDSGGSESRERREVGDARAMRYLLDGIMGHGHDMGESLTAYEASERRSRRTDEYRGKMAYLARVATEGERTDAKGKTVKSSGVRALFRRYGIGADTSEVTTRGGRVYVSNTIRETIWRERTDAELREYLSLDEETEITDRHRMSYGWGYTPDALASQARAEAQARIVAALESTYTYETIDPHWSPSTMANIEVTGFRINDEVLAQRRAALDAEYADILPLDETDEEG